jgi:hypothetical protein
MSDADWHPQPVRPQDVGAVPGQLWSNVTTTSSVRGRGHDRKLNCDACGFLAFPTHRMPSNIAPSASFHHTVIRAVRALIAEIHDLLP